MKILVIEDEEAIADALIHMLIKNKYLADACYDGESGLDNALTGIYDLIILDKVTGLDYGADDYITKPFAIDELLARIRSIQRRMNNNITNENIIKFSDISLDLQTYTLSCNSDSLHLGLKEFCIMEVFINNPNKVISKELLIEKIWGYESDAEYNNVEVYISFLRKKLNHIHSNSFIKTIRGVGYRLED